MASIERKWLNENAKIGKTTELFKKLVSGISANEETIRSSFCPTCGTKFPVGDIHEVKVHTFLTGHATIIERTKQTIITKKKEK